MARVPSFRSGRIAFDWRPPQVIGGTQSFDAGEHGLAQTGVAAGASALASVAGRYSTLVGSFSGGRHYFGAGGGAMRFGRRPWTISALASWTTSGSRGTLFGNGDTAGGNASFGISVNTGNNWAGFINTSSGFLSFVGSARDTSRIQRVDLLADGTGRFALAVDGVLTAWQTNTNPILDGTFSLAVGGAGEYTAGGYLGAYGDRWSGPIERIVVVHDECLFNANFDPFDPRPFIR